MTDYICIDCGAPWKVLSDSRWRMQWAEQGSGSEWRHQCAGPQAGHIGRRGPKPNKEQPNHDSHRKKIRKAVCQDRSTQSKGSAKDWANQGKEDG
jgi:hypothetical protein